MRIALTIFWIILGFLILWIFSLNVGQVVTVDFLFVKYEQVNLITIAFGSLFFGFVFGIIFFLIQMAKAKKVEFQLKKQIRFLQDELNKSGNKKIPSSRSENPQMDERGTDLDNENS